MAPRCSGGLFLPQDQKYKSMMIHILHFSTFNWRLLTFSKSWKEYYWMKLGNDNINWIEMVPIKSCISTRNYHYQREGYVLISCTSETQKNLTLSIFEKCFHLTIASNNRSCWIWDSSFKKVHTCRAYTKPSPLEAAVKFTQHEQAEGNSKEICRGHTLKFLIIY